ncbi:uncharacterized protein ACA1_138400 [Acanthamoeba castellanii str. Neff]|uniref:Uncharacterized protein n=1 Tax=Acanthamoeba castellanii (strain ATCC 30010 / Neff) TaxID=1257118 RepID=L8H0W9_ACACF|nr:uncharacterized protein ACA1_138400 [Acanthamoeba castellanii str. Neff]ELR18418.1 hypothetical protein ACA1_138400 [Acanthamoeba castellanii str. Neff]
MVPVELALRILRMTLTTNTASGTASCWLQHGPFAPAQFLQSLHLLHAALPRALRKAPVLDKIRHLILLPPMDGMLGIRRMSGEAAELEWDWEDHVRECLKALHRRQHGLCWASAKPTEVRGTVTDLWENLAVSFNLRSFGVHDTVSGKLMRLFETRGLMPTIFVALRPTASGDQVLAVLEHNETRIPLGQHSMVHLLGVYTDQEMALWDLSAVDAALSTAEVGGPAIKLESLDSVVMMEAQFCAAHLTRDAIALARPPSTSYLAAGGTSTTAQSPTPDNYLLVTVYDITAAIDASTSGGEDAPPRLRVIATAEVPQRTLTGVAFNSRLMAMVGGQQPEVLLFAFTPRQGNDPPPPLELTKLPRPLRVEAARYSMTQPCVALDDQRLYYYYDCNKVAIFNVQELLHASPGQTSDEAHNEGEEKVVVGQDWSHRALVAQLHAGPFPTSAPGVVVALARDRTGVVSVVTAEAVRLLVDPCSSIGVQAGDSEDLLLFPF